MSSTPDARLWRPSEAEAKAAGAVLGSAFVDEPIFVSVVADEAERDELCRALFTVNVRHACRFGGIWAIGDDRGAPLGIAYWTPQPEVAIGPETAAELGLSVVGDRWGGYLGRLGALECEALAPLAALGSGWRYLAGVGVDETARGRGIGTRLVRKILDEAREAGVPVGLVTDRARNVPWYERLGFVVLAAATPVDGPTFWTMKRP